MGQIVPLPYKHALKGFGENLQKARKERNISQEELAVLAGVGRTYISLVEQGKRNPSLRFLYRVSKALKIKSSNLLTF